MTFWTRPFFVIFLICSEHLFLIDEISSYLSINFFISIVSFNLLKTKTKQKMKVIRNIFFNKNIENWNSEKASWGFL